MWGEIAHPYCYVSDGVLFIRVCLEVFEEFILCFKDSTKDVLLVRFIYGY